MILNEIDQHIFSYCDECTKIILAITYPEKFTIDTKPLCSFAALNNHLNILIWARQNNYDWDPTVCNYAAKNGNLEMLIWAKENGCKYDTEIGYNAAKYGKLEVLKWAKLNKCTSPYICANAAEGDQLEILIWARQNGYKWDSSICSI